MMRRKSYEESAFRKKKKKKKLDGWKQGQNGRMKKRKYMIKQTDLKEKTHVLIKIIKEKCKESK